MQQLELAILGRDPALDLPATTSAPGTDEAGQSAQPAAARPAAVGGWPGSLAAGAAARARAGWRGGESRAAVEPRPAVIPGDAVGAISPSGGAIRAVVPLGTSPSAVAAGDGAVWVANYNAGTVSRIDPRTRGPWCRRSRSAHAERDRGRRRRGVGHQQLRSERVADRPGGEPGGADDPGRERADRGGGG